MILCQRPVGTESPARNRGSPIVRRVSIAGLCLSACLASPASAEDWYRIASSENSVDYADADTVRSAGETMSVEVLRGFDGIAGDGGYLRLVLDVSCEGNQFRVIRGVTYDVDRQYLTTDEVSTDWQAIAADSIAARIRSFTCDAALRDLPVPDPFDDADEYWYYAYGDPGGSSLGVDAI